VGHLSREILLAHRSIVRAEERSQIVRQLANGLVPRGGIG